MNALTGSRIALTLVFGIALLRTVPAAAQDEQLWPRMSGFPLHMIMLDPDICPPPAVPPGRYLQYPGIDHRRKHADDDFLAQLSALNLSEEQRSKIDEYRADLRRRNWELRGRAFDERDKLRELFRTPTPDPERIGNVYDAIFALQREMIVNRVLAANRMLAVLTPAQQDRLSDFNMGAPATGRYGD